MDVRGIFAQHISVASQAALDLPDTLAEVIECVARCICDGHKILACGNGGSASDAQHLTAELVGRFCRTRRALPAISLTSDPSTFSALANDFGFEEVFARQIEGLAHPGDVLIALTTSGNSPNVVRAAEAARRAGCRVVALTGSDGGRVAAHAQICVRAPSAVVARIQEIHTLCIHVIAEALDERLGR